MKNTTAKRMIVSACCAVAVALVAWISVHLFIEQYWRAFFGWESPKGALWCGMMAFGILLLCADIFAAVVLVMRFEILRPFVALIAFLAGVIAGFATGTGSATMTTCYLRLSRRSERTPHTLVKQQELIETFRGRGVIAHETYSRVVSVIRREMSA